MNELYHFGIKRRSGRYPYGSGDRPFQSENGRRLKDKSGNLNIKELKRRGIIRNVLTGEDRTIRDYKDKSISDKLKDEDFTLRKGSNLSRLSLSELENEKNIRKYVSISDNVEKNGKTCLRMDIGTLAINTYTVRSMRL